MDRPPSQADPNSAIPCDICNQSFRPRGFPNHRKKCEAKQIEATDRAKRAKIAKRKRTATLESTTGSGSKRPAVVKPWEAVGRLDVSEEASKLPAYHSFMNVAKLIPETIPDVAEPQPPLVDAIRTEYHPHTKLPPKIVQFEDYREYHSQHRRPTPRNPSKPWTPFRTRAEFEFAEVVLDAALNRRQIDTLLKVFHRCVEGEDRLDLKNHADLQEMWELASVLHTRVC